MIDDQPLNPQRVRAMQIVAGALITGGLLFCAYAVFSVQVQRNGRGMGAPGALPVITIMAVVVLLVMMPASLVVPRMLTSQALRQLIAGTWQAPPQAKPEDVATVGGKLMVVRQTSMIIGFAMLEGSAFLSCMAYFVEAQSIALVLVAFALIAMLFQFPTTARVASWLERQAEGLAELRRQKELDR
jgi:hypothetical protein